MPEGVRGRAAVRFSDRTRRGYGRRDDYSRSATSCPEQRIAVVVRLNFPYGELGPAMTVEVGLADRDGAFAGSTPPVRRDSSTRTTAPTTCSRAIVDVDRAVARTFAARVRLEALDLNRRGQFVGGIATFGFSLLQIIPLSPFSYADKAAQWSNNELIQLQVDGNKPIINQAHIDEYRGLSGLLIIPSSYLAEQMSRGRTLTVTTRAGARTFPIPTDAVKAFQHAPLL